ncbi:MAG TPA: TadE/TadG family type IV pilus assembly protein [Bryobacteraceae bacterium]|jgi:Flp pilus assembly protein TadG|nr:TadE/TadG family type IV pilus assembly protein [Bryobacteraceae bacterium]
MHSQQKRNRRKGAEIFEFGLVLVPLLGFVFLIIDVGWAVFARGVLQHAVREGVRYAVTSQIMSGLGQKDSIKHVVQSEAMGLLAGPAGLDRIQVRFYTPDTFTDVSSDAGANASGNLVEVSVEGFPHAPLLPLLRNALPFSLSATSIDRMEASPPTGPPPL